MTDRFSIAVNATLRYSLHHGPIPINNTTLMNDFETYENLESGNVSYKLTPFIL